MATKKEPGPGQMLVRSTVRGVTVAGIAGLSGFGANLLTDALTTRVEALRNSQLTTNPTGIVAGVMRLAIGLGTVWFPLMLLAGVVVNPRKGSETERRAKKRALVNLGVAQAAGVAAFALAPTVSAGTADLRARIRARLGLGPETASGGRGQPELPAARLARQLAALATEERLQGAMGGTAGLTERTTAAGGLSDLASRGGVTGRRQRLRAQMNTGGPSAPPGFRSPFQAGSFSGVGVRNLVGG